MVSKLEILQRFYHISLEKENDYFVYQNNHYYFCQVNNFTNIYTSYINSINLNGFKIVNNCFDRSVSMNYVLYTYQVESYELYTFIHRSLLPIDKVFEVSKIKSSWCKVLDEAKTKIGNYASRISHFEHYVVLSYYYQGLGESAIGILNQIKTKKIPLGVEHFCLEDRYESLCCPSNFLIASRIKDLVTCYKKDFITINQLEEYINCYSLSNDEIVYLFARILFPDEFMRIALANDCEEPHIKKQLITMYQNIDIERNKLHQAYELLKRYAMLPKISWL